MKKKIAEIVAITHGFVERERVSYFSETVRVVETDEKNDDIRV